MCCSLTQRQQAFLHTLKTQTQMQLLDRLLRQLVLDEVARQGGKQPRGWAPDALQRVMSAPAPSAKDAATIQVRRHTDNQLVDVQRTSRCGVSSDDEGEGKCGRPPCHVCLM